ncbi:putative GST-like protein YibF [compost metagenome]
MKLFHSPASPFVRKVTVTAIELGLASRIEPLPAAASPVRPDLAVAAHNPSGRVPTLLTDDGMALYDSAVICEYLDVLDGRQRVFPAPGPLRWRALQAQALGDGLLEAALLARYEGTLRPESCRWPAWTEGQLRKVSASLDAAAAHVAGADDAFDIGHITIACALGYLDFRFPALAWRERRTEAAAWFEAVQQRPSMVATQPADGGARQAPSGR